MWGRNLYDQKSRQYNKVGRFRQQHNFPGASVRFFEGQKFDRKLA